MRKCILKSFQRTCVLIVPLFISINIGFCSDTMPVKPKITETPLPAEVQLPAPPSIPADIPNRPLTADEAAAVALYHQPNITAAKAGVTAAVGKVQQAQSGLLPSLSTGAGYTNTVISHTTAGSSDGIGTSDGFKLTANLNQLLFDFNHTRDLVRQANAQQKSANAGLEKTQSDVIYQVKQAFYNYSQNLRLIEVNESNLKNQQNHLASAQAKVDAGLGLPMDVVRAQTAVADATLNLTIARNNASIARVNMAQLMGIDPRTPIEIADSGEPSEQADDLNALVDLAMTKRPEVKQAEHSISAAGYGVQAAKTSNSPAVSADLGWLGKGSTLSTDHDSLAYGITVTWTLFDSGYTKGRVTEANANLQTVQAQMETVKNTVTSDVSQAYLNLKTAEQRITTASAEVSNAEEATRLAEGRYSSGLGTFLDVLDAQNALLTAKTNQVNAESALSVARAGLSHATGSSVAKFQGEQMPK
ncbi:MAG: TolC family protein [Armatimonadota bacterium]